MYAVWQTHRTATVQQLGSTLPVDDTILLSRSTDGGCRIPATLRLTYYDFRNDALGDSKLSTDYWVVHCHAATADCTQASNWSDENRLTPTSFDVRAAPYASGYFTGDYEGLDYFGTTFTPFFVQGNGTDPFHPLSDAFYSTAGP